MSATDRWLESVDAIYGGEDDAKMFDRAMRVKGDVDRVIIEYSILQELRAIRQALESQSATAKR